MQEWGSSTPEMTPDTQSPQVSGREMGENETEGCGHNEERLNWRLDGREEQLDMSSWLVPTGTRVSWWPTLLSGVISGYMDMQQQKSITTKDQADLLNLDCPPGTC